MYVLIDCFIILPRGAVVVVIIWFESCSWQGVLETTLYGWKYFMLSTVGIFIYTNTGDYSMLNTVGRFIYTKYWEILYAEYCGNIYLHD